VATIRPTCAILKARQSLVSSPSASTLCATDPVAKNNPTGRTAFARVRRSAKLLSRPGESRAAHRRQSFALAPREIWLL